MLDPAHPVTPFFSHDPSEVLASLRAIAHSVRAAKKAGKPVSICGEMASRPLEAADDAHVLRQARSAAHLLQQAVGFGRFGPLLLFRQMIAPLDERLLRLAAAGRAGTKATGMAFC